MFWDEFPSTVGVPQSNSKRGPWTLLKFCFHTVGRKTAYTTFSPKDLGDAKQLLAVFRQFRVRGRFTHGPLVHNF